jgi:hypothetical protein
LLKGIIYVFVQNVRGCLHCSIKLQCTVSFVSCRRIRQQMIPWKRNTLEKSDIPRTSKEPQVSIQPVTVMDKRKNYIYLQLIALVLVKLYIINYPTCFD